MDVHAGAASQRNRRLAASLKEAGLGIGLRVEFEYPVVGGRIDVVWLWDGGPRFPLRLPLVGFEIESSWRTRKHIKGDLLNLMALQPALGVIVLAGGGPKVEATREFARTIVRRHASRIEVWDEARVVALVAGDDEALMRLVADVPAEAVQTPVAGHPGDKYAAITAWLTNQTVDDIETAFGTIEEVLGFPLPPSCRSHVGHWHSRQGSAVARAIQAAGWRASQVDLRAERLVLRRGRPSRRIA